MKLASGPAPLPALQEASLRQGRVRYLLSGEGPARIVLLNGAGVTVDGWRALYPAIERLGRVLAWNRFGVEGGDMPRTPQTAMAVTDALQELAQRVGLRPPFILVGHSLGGLHANLYARRFPHEVAAVLLLEATHPEDHVVLARHASGLARALRGVLSLPQKVFRRNLHAEMDCIADSVRELAGAGPFPDVPLIVLTGGQSPPGWLMSPAAVGARRAHQQELARLSPRGEHVIAQRSGHFPQITDPKLVLDLLARLVHRTSAESLARSG